MFAFSEEEKKDVILLSRLAKNAKPVGCCVNNEIW